jgi:hypothetical protein
MNELDTAIETNGAGEQADLYRHWVCQLKYAEKTQEAWATRAEKIVKRYRDDRDSNNSRAAKQNILFSNVETLRPAMFSRVPKTVVERRFKTAEPTSRLAAQALERATETSLDTQDFKAAIDDCITDYLLGGRGTTWERYVPKFGPAMVDPQTGEQVPVIESEEAVTDYVYWNDYLHEPARRWRDVTWVARKNYLARGAVSERFGESVAEQLSYDQVPQGLDDDKAPDADIERYGKAIIWEIWDKSSKQVIWINKDFPLPLDSKPDPLGLKEFFPCPRPLLASNTTDQLIPVPDFCVYQDLSDLLDTITAKISVLVKALRVAGVYDQSNDGLKRLISENCEFELIPVPGWAATVAQGGLEGAIMWFPLEQIANTLSGLYEARDRTTQAIYEVTGLSDIIRGLSNPNETATAQQIKGQFATLRIADRQAEVQRFLRDVIAIKAEIIAEHFQPESFFACVGDDLVKQQDQQAVMTFQQALQLLKDDKLRTYKVTIETDSTLAVDEQTAKAQVNEFMGAFGQFMNETQQFAQVAPAFAPAMGEMLLWALRHFRAGRQLEGSLENAIQQQLQMAAQAAQQPPPPDPRMVEAQTKMQINQQKAQQDGQIAQFRAQLDAQVKQHEMKLKEAAAAHSAQIDFAKMQNDANLKVQELMSTLALDAEKARAEILRKAAEMANVPENEETKAAARAATQPMVINVTTGGKKKVKFGYDELGERTALVEELIDE